MTGESEVAGVWAMVTLMALMIAMLVTAGYWFHVYRDENLLVQAYATEPSTTLQAIWDDLKPFGPRP